MTLGQFIVAAVFGLVIYGVGFYRGFSAGLSMQEDDDE